MMTWLRDEEVIEELATKVDNNGIGIGLEPREGVK
jgi:hypothetical protein